VVTRDPPKKLIMSTKMNSIIPLQFEITYGFSRTGTFTPPWQH
jgi:hypothetical protein